MACLLTFHDRPRPTPTYPSNGSFIRIVSSRSGLVELAGTAVASLRRAESWVETGKGSAPVTGKVKTLKRKV